jgi:hypothetical protein
VPDPNHAGQFGGFAHHTDPGRYWDWNRYLGYVKSYAKGTAPPVFAAPKPKAAPVSVRTKPATAPTKKSGGKATAVGPVFAVQGLRPGKGLTGFVPWQADVKPQNVARVEFLVDDTLRWTAKRAPFRFGGSDGKLDTTQLPNGPHVLSIRVVSKKGTVVGSSVRVGVANTPFAVGALSPGNGASVKGKVRLSAGVTGGLADHVEFVVDGRVVQTERNPPFELDWDTTKVTNGAHTLTLRGTAQDGRVATTSVTVVVANPASVAPTPAPPRLTSISLLGQSLRDGQSLSGLVRWDASVRGRDVERVDFLVDGALRWQDRGNPYRFNGDYGRWDTRGETNGQHVLTLRAVAVSGAEATTTIVVRVSNSSPSAAALTAKPAPSTSWTPTTTTTSSSSTTSTTRPTWTRPTWTRPTSTTTTTTTAPTSTHATTTTTPSTTTAPTTTAPASSSTSTRATTTTTAPTSTSSTTTTTTTTPAASLSVAVAGLTNGQTLSGSTHLVATTTGEARRVEFWVDGSYRHGETSAPYEYDLSTRRLWGGAHVLLVRVVGRGGTYADATIPFTVGR